MLTRREWSKLAFAGIAGSCLPAYALADKPNSKFKGVQIGAQSYSFRDRPLAEAIRGMVEAGISSCELWQGHVEPVGERGREAREKLRQWRLSVPLDEMKKVRSMFDAAAIDLYAYNLSFREDFTDAEIDRGFQMARALGVKAVTASSNVTTARRIDPFARRYKMRVGMHNHSRIQENEFATPDDFSKALAGNSKYIAINLDIGHFTAANFDAVDFLRKNHDRIVTLHIKDRKRNQGETVPFGEGDAPIKQVLALLQEHKWKIPANIEYEYRGGDTVQEVKRCLAYCKEALMARGGTR